MSRFDALSDQLNLGKCDWRSKTIGPVQLEGRARPVEKNRKGVYDLLKLAAEGK